MPIRVDRKLRAELRSAGGISIQIRESSDANRAAEALRNAANEIRSWPEDEDRPTPSYVSSVTDLPQGPHVWINIGSADPSLVATIPDLIAEHLKRCGVSQALIAELRSELSVFGLSPPGSTECVYARIHLTPGAQQWLGQIPEPLAQMALERLMEFQDPGDSVRVEIVGTALAVAPREAPEWIRRASQDRDLKSYYFYIGPAPDDFSFLALEVGGRQAMMGMAISPPGSTSASEWVKKFRIMREIVRNVVMSDAEQVATAVVDFSPHLGPAGARFWIHDWMEYIGIGPSPTLDLADVCIGDVAPYVLVSESHMRQMRDHSKFTRLGRFYERTIEPIEGWVLGSGGRGDLVREARSEMRDILLDPEKRDRLWGPRIEALRKR